MIDTHHGDNPVRRKIESLGSSIPLPTVNRALGILEGEHRSFRRGGNDELVDIRQYGVGDEARAIDWKISARTGRPMVVQRDRLSSSHVTLLLDGGMEMTASCPSGERAYEVAANALCMFAVLSLRRSDEVSLVIGDSKRITRVPFHGHFAQFERTLDTALDRSWNQPRHIDALLDYAQHVQPRNSLIVIASCEQAFTQEYVPKIRRIAQHHPVTVIDVGTVNPFSAHPFVHDPHACTVDGYSGRRVPAFLRTQQLAEQTKAHRAFALTSLQHELAQCGAQLIHASSSEAMFTEFVRMASLRQFGNPHAGSYLTSSMAGSRQ